MSKLERTILVYDYLIIFIFVLAVAVVNISRAQVSVEWLRFITELSTAELFFFMGLVALLLMIIISKFYDLCERYKDEFGEEDVFEDNAGKIAIVVMVLFIASSICSLVWTKSWLSAFSSTIITIFILMWCLLISIVDELLNRLHIKTKK